MPFSTTSVARNFGAHRAFPIPKTPDEVQPASPRAAVACLSALAAGLRLSGQHAAGAVDVHLRTSADAGAGTVDWRLEFPDGSVGLAQSRVTETTRGTCIYSFVLHAPPVALEQVAVVMSAAM